MPDFSSFPLKPELLRALRELNLTTPTPVQAEAIPLLLSGRDLIGQSKTGSGKTLAFALPLLHGLELNGLEALVLSPTRELSDQVTREFRKLGRHLGSLKVVSLVGGQPVFPQAHSLQRGAHVAVGTPGRVLDHMRRGTIDLSRVKFLVLDEADRMLDMGFAEEMEEILAALPSPVQTIFFSATFPATIEEMSARYQDKAARVTITAEETTPAIEQLGLVTNDKFRSLTECLSGYEPESALVFCHLKLTVAEVAERLESAGISAACLHGDLEQTDRDRVMAKFRNGSLKVLVATDVAARGIDVANLDLVVNYDFPKPDIYLHRIGRTGRAGKTGRAVSLLAAEEIFKVKRTEEETGVRIEKIDAPPAPANEAPALQEAKMTTLYISGGRREKVRPGDILGALTGEAGGLRASDVGKIEIHDRFAYVAVTTALADEVLLRLRDGKIKGRKFRVEKVL